VFERLVFLVVRHLDVERLQKFRQLVGFGVGEYGPEVGDVGEQRLDLVRIDADRPLRFSGRDLVLDRGSAAGEFFDPSLRERDDGMVRVVVLLEAERLPVERAVDV